MAEQKRALEAAREELAKVEERAASLDQRLKEVDHAEAKLQKAQAEFGDLSLNNQKGREELEALKLGGRHHAQRSRPDRPRGKTSQRHPQRTRDAHRAA